MDTMTKEEKQFWALPAKTRNAIMKKRTRLIERRTAKKVYAAKLPHQGGYCCPGCHTWHATADLRNACKRSH